MRKDGGPLAIQDEQEYERSLEPWQHYVASSTGFDAHWLAIPHWSRDHLDMDDECVCE